MTETRHVNLKREIDESYDVIFGKGLFPRIAQDLNQLQLASKYIILTDQNVYQPHALSLVDELQAAGLSVSLMSIEPGEQSKNRVTKESIEDTMFRQGMGRDSALIAIGGGVIGDLGGFVAATFQRGIPYIQIPTSVLAQADSAIGGKTGIDTPHAKNSLGAFKQPFRVYIDIATLATLPQEEIRNGLAESIKHGVIQDNGYSTWLEHRIAAAINGDPEALLYIAEQNVRIKANVVEQDPTEKGLRRILNFGHTIGHAVEKLSKYKRAHGQCVAIGMMPAARIAAQVTGFNGIGIDRLEHLLIDAGLPTKIPSEYTNEDIIEITTRDKKAKNGQARYCLPIKFGEMADFDGAYATHVDNELVMSCLDASR